MIGALAIETVAAPHIDRAIEHEPGWGMQLANVEDYLSGREGPLAKRFAVSTCSASSTGNIW